MTGGEAKGIVMSMHRKMLRLVLVGLGLSVAQTAMAEPTTSSKNLDNGDYSYQFSDEDLLGDTLGAVGDMYRGRPKYARVLLLRPRTSLVQELIKSAEGL